MSIADIEVAKVLNKVRAPYSISKITSQIGKRDSAVSQFVLPELICSPLLLACFSLAALQAFSPENIEKMRKTVEVIKSERDKVMEALKGIKGVKKVFPSDTNFVMFRIENSFAVYKAVADSGVVSRFRGTEINCEECIRVTIGTLEENEAYLAKVRKMVEEGKL